MPQLLPGLMQEAPGVSLQTLAADPFQVRQLLEEDRIDVAVSLNKQSRGEIVSEPAVSYTHLDVYKRQGSQSAK